MIIYMQAPRGGVNVEADGFMGNAFNMTTHYFYDKRPSLTDPEKMVYDFEKDIQPQKVAAKLRYKFPDGPGERLFTFDIERFRYQNSNGEWKTVGDMYKLPDERIEFYSKKIIECVRSFEEFAPNSQRVLYRIFPQRGECWWTALYKTRGLNWEERYQRWDSHCDRLAYLRGSRTGLTDVFNAICPSLYPMWTGRESWYTPSMAMEAWYQFAHWQLTMSASYGKEVYAYVIPYLARKETGYAPLDHSMMQDMLHYLSEHKYCHRAIVYHFQDCRGSWYENIRGWRETAPFAESKTAIAGSDQEDSLSVGDFDDPQEL